jgi:hypothetical protein
VLGVALNSAPFGLVHGFPRGSVSKRRLVLECRRDSAASTDLRAMECANPIDSVHPVMARFIEELRILLRAELVVHRMAINPVYAAGSVLNAELRQEEGRATSSILPL